MTTQIDRIKEKLRLLKRLDTALSIFGASKHQYKINRTVSPKTIKRFEASNRIKLPEEYIKFLTEVGNGGAGPYYGLESLENSLFQDLDYKKSDSIKYCAFHSLITIKEEVQQILSLMLQLRHWAVTSQRASMRISNNIIVLELGFRLSNFNPKN